MNAITPLIICGMGRSGTRNAANVMNVHDRILLHGEMPSAIMKRLFLLLDTTDASYAGNREDMWLAKKANFIFDAFRLLGKAAKDESLTKPSPTFVGHKTPHHEALFGDYEKHFGSVGMKPLYFYCARNVVSCWRSYKSLGWGSRTIKGFIEEYTTSFSHLESMRAACADRVFVVSLDELIASEDKIAYYTRRIFDPLGLSLTPEMTTRIENLPNNNALARATGKPAAEVTDDEIAAIKSNAAVRRIQDMYFTKAG